MPLTDLTAQIWFQNRRQNSRRKSRPLLSHEIIPHLRTSFDASTMGGADSSMLQDDLHQEGEEPESGSFIQDELTLPVNSAAESGIPSQAPRDKPGPNGTTHQSFDPATQETINIGSQVTDGTEQSQPTDQPSQETVATDLNSSQPKFTSQETKEGPQPGMGYLANRRSASFMKYNEEAFAGAPMVASSVERQEPQPARTLGRTRSFLRLSMTSDGKAKVVSNADQSPSPPRSQPTASTFDERVGGLRRSYSAAGLSEKLKQAGTEPSARKFQRTSSGRSRDSRAWEFWCDSDARNSLAEKADQERSGSAADAIGLIRSTSRGILRSIPNKRNLPVAPQTPAKRLKLEFDRPQLLPPPSASVGDIPTKNPAPAKAVAKTKSPAKRKAADSQGDEFEMPNTESDKENWEPAEQPSQRRIPQVQQDRRTGRQVLGENTQVLSQNSSLGAMMAREKRQKTGTKRGAEDSENGNPEDDEEIADFMKGRENSSGRTSVSSGEDLDCVQGLLKLSQGNWR